MPDSGLSIKMHYQKGDPADEARVEKVREGIRLIADALELGPVKESTYTYPNGQTERVFAAAG